MQQVLDFGACVDIAMMRDLLRPIFPRPSDRPQLDLLAQLIRSLLGSRTRDAVSWQAFWDLVDRFPDWADLACAPVAEVEAIIADVTFADDKAKRIIETLQRIMVLRGEYRLEFLAELPVEASLAWLRRLKGVGPKIAAATLNFSIRQGSAFVVDTHILRVLQRFGMIGPNADIDRAFQVVTSATRGWSADELQELHFLLKRLGQTWCRHSIAECGPCPLQSRCQRRTCTEQKMPRVAKSPAPLGAGAYDQLRLQY
ncbi:endonuclease III domain-containing protein [Mesorhizobium sp. ZC-5]|uniref:endonuclease III domain-containing protein n=1 Tax=Mesorhizobium sp. ZC-5 TaxID=2986066 RepID=UPI0021E74280|nr:endonuclease [Mesorhizobium sp. ZC-5]MCV3241572.1 endonuclease [Mesorhizobium sp. ZC-5]